MNHKIITFTGLDRVGKQCQTNLLLKALQPSTHMTFPEYADGNGNGHWAAEIVRGALNQEKVTIQRESGPALEFYPRKDAYVFQMCQSADRVDKQEWIKETLKTSHIVADRYEIDAMAYGLVDGCDRKWLEAMAGLYYPSDIIFCLVGSPFPREGEVPDLNERDSAFQDKVRRAYWELAEKDDRIFMINVDAYRQSDPVSSKQAIHWEICDILKDRYPELGIRLLNYGDVQAHGTRK